MDDTCFVDQSHSSEKKKPIGIMDFFVHQVKIATTPIQSDWHTSDYKTVLKSYKIDYMTINRSSCTVYFFFLRSSNLLVRSSKSTSSPPALFPPGILSGKFGKSVGTAGRSGKLGPDEERGALGAGG